jgi:N-acetylneuraminic acid mutarotase
MVDSCFSLSSGGAGAWTPTGNLATGRTGFTASLLLNGKALVVGGESRSGVLASAELFQ